MKCAGVLAIMSVGLAATSDLAQAQTNLTHHGTFRAWQVFLLEGPNFKACYAATVASRYNPQAPARERPVLYIVRYPKTTSRNTIEIRFGGDVSSFQSVTAKLLARRRPPRDNFPLTLKSGAGFIADSVDQDTLIKAMRKGRQILVVSQPGVGEILEDRYSMFGFTKALAKLEQICPGPQPIAPVPDQTAQENNSNNVNAPAVAAPKPGGDNR